MVSVAQLCTLLLISLQTSDLSVECLDGSSKFCNVIVGLRDKGGKLLDIIFCSFDFKAKLLLAIVDPFLVRFVDLLLVLHLFTAFHGHFTQHLKDLPHGRHR
jgi:hypothetical protein